jgi:hypothetical protein
MQFPDMDTRGQACAVAVATLPVTGARTWNLGKKRSHDTQRLGEVEDRPKHGASHSSTQHLFESPSPCATAVGSPGFSRHLRELIFINNEDGDSHSGPLSSSGHLERVVRAWFRSMDSFGSPASLRWDPHCCPRLNMQKGSLRHS